MQINKYYNKEFYKTRSGKIILNLSSSIVLKFVNMAISFIMIPISLSYLDKIRYGLWAALSSILAWIFIFDIGIGSGLRNKYIELKALGKMKEIKSYVSTAYFLFGIIAIVIASLFFILSPQIHWSRILNAPLNMDQELNHTAMIVVVIMCFSFVFKLINTILIADLKNAISDGFVVLSHLITLIGLLFIVKYTSASITKFAILYTGSNLLVSIMASIVLFSGHYKQISPSIDFIDLKLWKDLVSVGLKFFFIALSLNLMTHATGLLISNLLGPEYVTDYTVNMRYFSISSMLFAMLVQPLWSGYGDAYHKKDFAWIKITFKRLQKLLILVVFSLIVMVIFQKPIFDLWLKGKVIADTQLSILFVIYFCLYMFNAIYNPFINATSKIKLQMLTYLSMTVLFFVMSVVFVKVFGYDVKGVMIALILFHALPLAILTPIQAYKILAGKQGIWNK